MYIINDNSKLEIKMRNNILNRFMGFMFKKNITFGLCFPKCNSIHTFFMLRAIDVIMTDKDYNILYIFNNIKPNRIILPKKNVYYTFELPIDMFEFNIKEKLKVTDF